MVNVLLVVISFKFIFCKNIGFDLKTRENLPF